MNTLEAKIVKKKEKLAAMLPELKPVMFKPMGKLAGLTPKCDHNKMFDQWQQGFNQYGK